ncbi:MAG: F0F1 ATP synthase subunit gamma [Gammaproteobacteria bacterium]
MDGGGGGQPHTPAGGANCPGGSGPPAGTQASKHSSRLAALQAAEKNLDERMEEVLTQYRRIRQNTITAELLDVVAGFEALTTS